MMRFMVCSSVFKFFEIKKPVLKKDGLAARVTTFVRRLLTQNSLFEYYILAPL